MKEVITMLLFDILASILGKSKEFYESEQGQAYRAASRAKRASDDMDKTLKEMDEMNKSLYEDDWWSELSPCHRLTQEHTKPLLFLCSQEKNHPALAKGQGGIFVYFLVLVFFFCFGSTSFLGSEINSDIFSGDRCHVRTAGDKGCCNLALPFSPVRQWSLSS